MLNQFHTAEGTSSDRLELTQLAERNVVELALLTLARGSRTAVHLLVANRLTTLLLLLHDIREITEQRLEVIALEHQAFNTPLLYIETRREEADSLKHRTLQLTAMTFAFRGSR